MFILFTGRPQPKLTWWHENELIDDSYDAISEKKVQNLLHFHNLTRDHLHTSLTCQASNNNITTPISSAVTLNVNRKYISLFLVLYYLFYIIYINTYIENTYCIITYSKIICKFYENKFVQ